MKLRIRDASIRLRLTRSELAQLRDTGRVDAATPLGPDLTFLYALETADVDDLGVHYAPGSLTVVLPRGWIGRWADTEQVGFERLLDVGADESLRVLVEKDFRCLVPRSAAEDGDAFPHPAAGRSR